MLRFVRVLIIEMYKGTLDLRQVLKLLLQGFPNVVSLLQGHVCWQDYVNLHKVVRAKGVCPDCIDMFYGLVMVPTEVCQFL